MTEGNLHVTFGTQLKKKLLWIGDAGCPSGFARATHEILNVLHQTYDVTVLGVNYRGDPHDYPYPIYAAAVEGDVMGVLRLPWMCHVVKPDIIVAQNDGWNIPNYVRQLKKYKEFADIPFVAAVAVDGKNFRGEWLNGITSAVFWTEFAAKEAREGGYTGPLHVIPLGVDTEMYWPMPRIAARQRLGLPSHMSKMFLVGNVNRNQPRKRWDLTIKYFAEWVKARQPDDAYLYLHVAPTGDLGVDVKQMAQYYGIIERIALMEPPIWYGSSEEQMVDTYNSFDVQVSTTQGEGFGLTTFEGMACGVPQIVPEWSALGELCRGAAEVIPCSTTAIGPPYINVIGGVPDQDAFVGALDFLYQHKHERDALAAKGLARAREDRFRWANVGAAWREVIDEVLSPRATEAVWQDLGRPEVVA